MTARICSRRFCASVAVVVAMLAVTACGSSSSSKVSADSYVKSVCTTAASWYRTIQDAGRRLQTTVHSSKSLSKDKGAYLDFVDSLLHATQQADQQLKNAGIPSVNGGKKVSDELINAFDGAQRGLKNAVAQVRRAPTGSSTAFEAAVGGVQSTVQRALQSMSALAAEKNPQLHAAALKEPSCQRLRGLG